MAAIFYREFKIMVIKCCSRQPDHMHTYVEILQILEEFSWAYNKKCIKNCILI